MADVAHGRSEVSVVAVMTKVSNSKCNTKSVEGTPTIKLCGVVDHEYQLLCIKFEWEQTNGSLDLANETLVPVTVLLVVVSASN